MLTQTQTQNANTKLPLSPTCVSISESLGSVVWVEAGVSLPAAPSLSSQIRETEPVNSPLQVLTWQKDDCKLQSPAFSFPVDEQPDSVP